MFTLPTAVEAPTDVLGYQPIPNTLHVSWTPPSPLGHATGYRIYYNGDDGSSGTLDVSGSMSHSQVLRGLSSGVSYTLSVVALSVHLPSPVAQHGQPIPISEQSLFVSISEQYYYMSLTVPQPSVTVDRIQATSVNINWSASFGADRYEILYERATGGQQEGHCPSQSHSGLVKVSAPTTSVTITGLEEFSTYRITVTARRGKHSFVDSETVSFMTSSAGTLYMYLIEMHELNTYTLDT